MRLEQQRGTSTLAAIATLFAFGLFLLSALHRQLDNIQKITVEEQHHLRAFNQATSSLNWGLTQSWSFSLPWQKRAPWHCHEQPQYGLKACIRPSSLAGFFILRGEGQYLSKQPQLVLYQRVKLPSGEGERTEHRLIKAAHGWLDFCPEKDAKFCL